MITNDYTAYLKAKKILNARWKATLEDLAVWISLGPDSGGIAAYRNANELNPPPRFYFEYSMGDDYLSPLMACWFRQDDIDRFEPADYYITGAALIERWRKQLGLQTEAFICAKIAESRLLDMHPIFGLTRDHFGIKPHSLTEESLTEDEEPVIEEPLPPLSAGLFAMSKIEQIEAEDGFDVQVLPGAEADEHVQGGTHNKGGRPKGPLAEAVEMAYLHFRDQGNTDILQPGNIRSFLKSFGNLAKDDTQLKDLGKRNIANGICGRIKEVKNPRAGESFVETHDRREGGKINPGKRYSQKTIAKLLTDLRKKYPLPT